MTAAVVVGLAAATSLACNAILGADDYKVGQANDDGGGVGPGDTGGAGNDTGGAGNDTGGAGNDTGGRGSGGKGAGGSPNAGGSNPGTGGRGTGGRVGTGGTTTGTGGSSTGVNAFIGSWSTDEETTTVTCSDGMPPMTDVGPDQLDWTEGTAAGTIETYVPVADCIAVADVSGKVATLPKMSCTDSMGITYTLSGTFTIQADGTARLLETVTLSMNGFSCTIDASGIFTML